MFKTDLGRLDGGTVPTRRAKRVRSPDAWKRSPLGEALQYAGLTPGELTDRMGAAYIDVLDIAERQLELGSLPLDTAKLIADALYLPLAELPRFDDEKSPTQKELDGSPGRTLIAVLNEAQSPPSIGIVSEQLGWNSEEIYRSVSTANTQLAGTGFVVTIDEKDCLNLNRQDSPEIQALASAIHSSSTERHNGGLPPLDSCAINFALMDLAQGDIDGFNRSRLDANQLERLVDEDVIEPLGDSYWLTPRAIEFLDLGIPTAKQLNGVNPSSWVEASKEIREHSVFGVPDLALRSSRRQVFGSSK